MANQDIVLRSPGSNPQDISISNPATTYDSKIWVRVSGVWRQAVPYVKVSGAWQVSKPKFNDADTWKP